MSSSTLPMRGSTRASLAGEKAALADVRGARAADAAPVGVARRRLIAGRLACGAQDEPRIRVRRVRQDRLVRERESLGRLPFGQGAAGLRAQRATRGV